MKLFVLILVAISAQFIFAAEPQTQTKPTAKKISPNLETQIWLDRKGFSPGEIDGTMGKNTQKALFSFEEANQLPETTKALNSLREQDIEPIITYTVTADDVNGPYEEKIPNDYMEQATMKSLSYTSELEALGEKFHSSPRLLKKLNPKSDFSTGSEIFVPNVITEKPEEPKKKVQPVSAKKQQTQTSATDVSIIISKEKSQLEVKDADGKTIFFAPITAGSDQYPYPAGSWKVKGVSKNPRFEYDPSLFKDAPEKDTKATLPAGPNSPVGVVWIEITTPHYGIHGTPEPDHIGYSESHGCIRLTNWDATKLAGMVRFGTPVIFE
jgi:lipoprotein-anchoring transpeptidase ErfK/SrfK